MKQEVDRSQVWSQTKSWTYPNTKMKQFLIHLLVRYTEILKFNHPPPHIMKTSDIYLWLNFQSVRLYYISHQICPTLDNPLWDVVD